MFLVLAIVMLVLSIPLYVPLVKIIVSFPILPLMPSLVVLSIITSVADKPLLKIKTVVNNNVKTIKTFKK